MLASKLQNYGKQTTKQPSIQFNFTTTPQFNSILLLHLYTTTPTSPRPLSASPPLPSVGIASASPSSLPRLPPSVPVLSAPSPPTRLQQRCAEGNSSFPSSHSSSSACVRQWLVAACRLVCASWLSADSSRRITQQLNRLQQPNVACSGQQLGAVCRDSVSSSG